MADAVTREASKKGAVLAARTQAVSEVSTQKKGSTTAKLQLLSSGGLRLITASGTAPGQTTNTGEPAKGQQRFFTRQTPDGQWQLLMSCDSDPGRVYLLQAPTSQPVRASESKAVSKATKTDSSSSKMPMKVFLVNPKDNKLISSVASNGRSLLGGQEKTVSQAAKVPGKAISLLPSSLHFAKVETTSVKAASPGGNAEAGSAGNAPISNTEGSYLVSVPTITPSTQRTPRRWSAARSPRLVQLEKPITSRRANRVVKPAAAALLSGALKKCKKFPKIKEEPVIKKKKVFDRDPAGYDSDSADDLPVTFPFKIDSVFSLSSADPAAATLNEANEAQYAEVKVEVKGKPASEQFGQEELSQEELLDLCGSSFVVLERLSKQNIDEKGQPRLRSRCSDHCRKRTLKYLCMLNLIKCRPSKMRRDERDAGGGQSEERTSDEGSSGERVMHGEGGAEYAGLAVSKASRNVIPDFPSKRRWADIKSVVSGVMLPTVSMHVGVISDVTHVPIVRQGPSGKSKSTTVTFANGSDDASDKRGVVQDDVSGVKKSEGVKRAPAHAETPTTLSPRPMQAASAAVKNLAKLVSKGSVAMSEQEKKLVFLARKELKTSSSSLMGHSSPSAPAPSVSCIQLLSAPGMGPTATGVVPAVTSSSSGTTSSVPPTSCVLTFIITTSASTVTSSRPSLVTSSSMSKPAGLQTLMVPGSFQTVPSAAATVRQPKAMSKTVPLLQTPASLVSFLQGSKIGKTSPAILSASPQPTVVMTAVAPPASGLQMTPMTAVVPTSKTPCFTSSAGVTSMSSALTTATCSVTSLSSPASSVGLQPIAPKGQSTSQTSAAAILMSVAVDDSLSQTLHTTPTPGLVTDSSVTSTAIPTILTFSKPILTSVPQLPSGGELSDLKTIPLSSPCVTSANVSSIEPFPSSLAKCPPLRTSVTPTVTPGSKGPLVTIPSSSFKSSKSKIKIVFPVSSTATSVVTGKSLLKAIPSSAPTATTSSHSAASPNLVGLSNAGEVPSGSIPSSNTDPVVSGASMQPGSSSSGSGSRKVKVVTVVFPKAARASAGSQTVPSQLLNANLPAGLRLVKCGKPENGHQPRPKYTLFSSGSKMASACKPEEGPAGESEGEGMATAAQEAVMGEPSSTTTCTASGKDAEQEPAAKRRSTKGKEDAERRAKRARLEKRYPLPPGVVIKCEPVTSGYPGDDPPNAAPTKEPPPACMADDDRSSQTSGQAAVRGEETLLEPPGGNEVEAQLPELETGDEAVSRDEAETDDFLFDEPPILTPVSPLEPGISPDTVSLVTELSAALHQKPASRLRVRIVSATGKDVAADTPPSSSSSSSLGSAAPSSSSFPGYIPKTTSSVSSTYANDRIRKLKEQLRQQQEELDEIRKRRALQKPFCLEGDN